MSKKSRKLIRATPTAEDVAAEAVIEAVEPTAERTFFFLPDVEPTVVDERELHDEMKLWRHGRATRTFGQVFQDGLPSSCSASP